MRTIRVMFLFTLLLTMAPLHAQASDPSRISEADLAIENAPDAFNPIEPRDAAQLQLDDFLWVARPLIVFADSPLDPRFIEQMRLLALDPNSLIVRDVVIIVDTDPSARSPIRLNLRPNGFSLVVITKRGGVGFRRPSPRDIREINVGIDNFSLRQGVSRMIEQ